MATEINLVPDIDDALRREAEAIYARSGLTLSDAFRRLLEYTVEEQHIPLDFLTPTAETLEAMAELKRGEGKTFLTLEDLMADLNADD